MSHEFEVNGEIEVEATPEQIWDAIATGPGIDSWLMGHSEVEPGLGGRNKLDAGGFVNESTITVWDPPHRLVFKGEPDQDGAFAAFEYLIEARDGGSTVLRFVHSGFMAGDGWEAEYDALRKGDLAYLFKLGEYLKYFPGRYAAPIGGFAGQVADKEKAWATYRAGLGLSGPSAVGDKVRLTPAGLPPVEGVVDFVNDDFLGVRTEDAIYWFIHGFMGSILIGHHIFGEVGQPAPDVKEAEQAWQTWLTELFA